MPSELIGKHEKWMKDRGLAPSYIRTRVLTLNRLERSAGKPVSQCSHQDLLTWRRSLRKGPDWIATQVSHVHQFYCWCAEHGHRRTNPAKGIAIPRRTKHRPRPMNFTDLANAIASAAPQVRLMLVLGGWLGLRACELAGLRWESIDLTSAMVIVTAESSKGRRERIVPLPPWVIEEIGRYGFRPSGWVFPRLDGQPGPNRNWRVSQLVNDHLRDSGSRYTLHSARHWFATEVLAQCHDLRVVQELLGHQSPETTAIYTKVRMASAVSAVAALPVPA